MWSISLIVLGLYICQASAVTNLEYRITESTPSSCVGSSGNTATVCLNQEVTFTCTISGTSLLRWTASATGATTAVLFPSTDPTVTTSTLENTMLGISFTAVLQSREGDVFNSTLSATINSNAYDGINITCDDVTGTGVATLPLELVNTPPSSPRQNQQANRCTCINNASTVVMWDCPVDRRGTNITGFTVSVDVNGMTNYMYSVGPNDLSVTIDGMQVNTNYTATVTASNCNGTSEASTTTIFISADCMDLPPPTNLSSCRLDPSSIQIDWMNPQMNGGLFCPVCQILIRNTNGTTINDALPDATSIVIEDVVQSATYHVTYRTADGCEASSVVNTENLMDCSPNPTNITTSTPSTTPTPLTDPTTPTTSRTDRTAQGVAVAAVGGGVGGGVVVILLIGSDIILFLIWWKKRAIISKCFETVIIIILILTVFGIPFAIAIVCCLNKKERKPKNREGFPEQSGPVYDEVQPVTADADLQTETNVAYFPVEHPGTFEMGDNVAYGSRSVGH